MSAPTIRAAYLEKLGAMVRCQSLGHPDAHWVRRVLSNGAAHLQYWCQTCERAVTQACYPTAGGASVTAEWFGREVGTLADELPEVRAGVRYTLCARCGATTTCERHHIAPQAIFADAERWPVVPLCRSCHDEWTQTLEAYIQQRIAAARRAPAVRRSEIRETA